MLVLRLITSASIDEKIVERAAAKRKLEKLIIQSGKFKEARQSERSFDKALNEEELLALLKERDHDRIHRTTTGNGRYKTTTPHFNLNVNNITIIYCKVLIVDPQLVKSASYYIASWM